MLNLVERAVKGKAVVASVHGGRVGRKGLRGSGPAVNISSVRLGGGVAFHPEREDPKDPEREIPTNLLHRSLKAHYSQTTSVKSTGNYASHFRAYGTDKIGKCEKLRYQEEGGGDEMKPSPSSSIHSSSGVLDTDEMGGHGEGETIFDAGAENGEMEVELMTKGDAHEGASGEHLVQKRNYYASEDNRESGKENQTRLAEEESLPFESSHIDDVLGNNARDNFSAQNVPLAKAVRSEKYSTYAAEVNDKASPNSHQSHNVLQVGKKKRKEEGDEDTHSEVSRSNAISSAHGFRVSSGSGTSFSTASSSLVSSHSSDNSSSLPSSSLENHAFPAMGENITDQNGLPTSCTYTATRTDNDSGNREVEGGAGDSYGHSQLVHGGETSEVSSSPHHTSSGSNLSSFNPIRRAAVASANAESISSSDTSGGNDKGNSTLGGKSVEAYRFLLHHIDAEIAALKRRHTSVTSHRVQLEEQQASRIRELYNFMESPWLLLKAAHPPPLPATGVEVFLKEQMMLKKGNVSSTTDSSVAVLSSNSQKGVGVSSSAPLDLSREKMFVLACQKNYRSLLQAEKRIYEEAAKFNAALREEMKRRLSSGCSYFEEFCEQIQECTPSMVREGRLPAPPPGTPSNFFTGISSESGEEGSSAANRFPGTGGRATFFRRGAISRGMPALAAAAMTTPTSVRVGGNGKHKTVSSNASFSTPVARVMSRGVMRVQHRPASDPLLSSSDVVGISHNNTTNNSTVRHQEGGTVASGVSSSSNITSQKGFQLGKANHRLSSFNPKRGMISALDSSSTARKDSNTSSSTPSTDIHTSGSTSNGASPTRQRRLSPLSSFRGANGSSVGKEMHLPSKMEKHSLRFRNSEAHHSSNSNAGSTTGAPHAHQHHLKGKASGKMSSKLRQQPKKKAKRAVENGSRVTRKAKGVASLVVKRGGKASAKVGSSQKHPSSVFSSSSTHGSGSVSRKGEKNKKKQSDRHKKAGVPGSLKGMDGAAQKRSSSSRVLSNRTGQGNKLSRGGRTTKLVGSSYSGKNNTGHTTHNSSSSSSSGNANSIPSSISPPSKTSRFLVNRFNSPKMGSVVVINEHRSPSLPLPQVTPRIPVGKKRSSKRRKVHPAGKHWKK